MYFGNPWCLSSGEMCFGGSGGHTDSLEGVNCAGVEMTGFLAYITRQVLLLECRGKNVVCFCQKCLCFLHFRRLFLLSLQLIGFQVDSGNLGTESFHCLGLPLPLWRISCVFLLL